jgi:Zn-dependent protease with chaperone function
MSTLNPAVGDPSIDVGSLERVEIERWPTERPLFVVSALIGLVAWVVLIVTIIGGLYALAFGLFVFFLHVLFVTHVRGNAVRLGPHQFPELFVNVRRIAGRMGMRRMPEVYLMQAGGALNAFATKFLGTNMVVLFSDLLEACGDNTSARDMIIAHELGHIHAGHLKWRWLLLPSSFVPFLALALSRAREYTCDRYGLAGAGDWEGALVGLSVLAAGGKHGPLVNRRALVAQRRDLNTGWMTIGQWMSTHPPLAKRMAALDPTLQEGESSSAAGTLRAFAIMFGFLAVTVGGVFVVATMASGLVARFAPGLLQGDTAAEETGDTFGGPGTAFEPATTAAGDLREAFAAISSFINEEVAMGRPLPSNWADLNDRWTAGKGLDVPMPLDPYDGAPLGYDLTATGYRLWSSGPDSQAGTEDDIVFEGN